MSGKSSTNHTIRLKRLASFFKFLNSFPQSRLASLNGNVQAVALLAEQSLPTPYIRSSNHNRGKIFKFISKCVFNTKDEINDWPVYNNFRLWLYVSAANHSVIEIHCTCLWSMLRHSNKLFIASILFVASILFKASILPQQQRADRRHDRKNRRLVIEVTSTTILTTTENFDHQKFTEIFFAV